MFISLCLAWAALAPISASAGRNQPAAAHPPGSLQPERSTAPIIVVWPPEGTAIPQSDGEFILGSVSVPTAPFTINGQTVAVYRNGAFLAWLPVTPGTFTFNCSLGLSAAPAVFARNITVTPPAAALPARPMALDEDSIWPKTDMELHPGDWLAFRLRASPGHKARCRLGKGPWTDLREYGNNVYEAMQAVVPGDSQPPAPVECRVGEGWSTLRGLSRGRAALSSAPPSVAVVKAHSVLRSGPGNGYMAFPPAGTRLAVSGRTGNELRVSLAPYWDAWIDAKDVELLPPGTALPRAVAGAVHTLANPNGTTIKVGLSEKVAFVLDPSPESGLLVLRIFTA
jgi:N-acetylmuramoyl-L-alanine amidase